MIFDDNSKIIFVKSSYQRTNGPVDAHLLGLVKHKTWIIYGKEMTLTFNTHIPS